MTSSFAHESASSPLHGEVLYIEDQPSSFALVEAILAVHPGLRVINAPTGAEGIALARTNRPNAILLDMRLPDMSGVDVVRELSNELAEGLYRIILLTAEPLSLDVLKAMSLGAALYIPKPIDFSALESALARALSPTSNRPRKPSASTD